MTSYLAPGGPAWYLCRSRGWVFSFYDAPHPTLTVLPRRPTPLLLARAGVRQGEQLPPTGSTAWPALTAPGRPRFTQIPTLWRHWLWWRRNLYREHLRRGDLSYLADPPDPAAPRASLPAPLDLTDDDHYASLLAASMAGDLWVRRYRGLRRRRLTVHTAPPRPAGVRRTLFWAHRSHADLTWAPRPPRPAHIRARRGRRRTTAIKSTLLILFLGPIGLLMLLLGFGRARPPGPHYLPPPQPWPRSTMPGGIQHYATYWHTTGYKYHRF